MASPIQECLLLKNSSYLLSYPVEQIGNLLVDFQDTKTYKNLKFCGMYKPNFLEGLSGSTFLHCINIYLHKYRILIERCFCKSLKDIQLRDLKEMIKPNIYNF